MQWFKHQAAAHEEEKLALLRREFGAEGTGLYWYAMERVVAAIDALNVHLTCPISTSLIATENKVTTTKANKIFEFMATIGMVEIITIQKKSI